MPAACSASTIATNSAISLTGFAGVAGVRREVAESRVAPVVSPVGGEQAGLGRAGLHGQQFQRRHREALQILDDGRVGDALEGALQVRGDLRVQLGQADHVRLVDHRLFPGHPRPDRGRGGGDPAIDAGHHDGERHLAQGVDAGGRGGDQVVIGGGDLPRVRVQQDLRRIAGRHPESVDLTRADVGHEGVPDAVGAFVHRHPSLGAVGGDQAQLDVGHPGHAVGDDGEVGAALIGGGAQRVGQARIGRRAHPRRGLRVDLTRTASSLGLGFLLRGFERRPAVNVVRRAVDRTVLLIGGCRCAAGHWLILPDAIASHRRWV